MASKTIDVLLSADGPIKIKKWKVKIGMTLAARQIIMLYENVNASAPNQVLKYKCSDVGTVKKVCAPENSTVKPGDLLLMLEECMHPTVMKDMCAECGADLRQSESSKINASVPMVHSIPELKVSEELAQTLGKADEVRLLRDRKLVLLVDLDQTLIHTTNDNIPANLKDVVHFRLYGPHSPWYHTRIRPGTAKFLESVSELFELHICTFGARNYAHHIAMFLDPSGRFFSHRILSRDECFDANSKTANLKALFPCGDAMVCIIDDREDVWNYAPNLIHVKPYHFFQHTGDINAPPGLTKKENDTTEEGFDFTSMAQQKPKEDHEGDKKISISKTKKTEPSGETTTDKDTEDEKEIKPVKLNSSRKSVEGLHTPVVSDTITTNNITVEDESCEKLLEAQEQSLEKISIDATPPSCTNEVEDNATEVSDSLGPLIKSDEPMEVAAMETDTFTNETVNNVEAEQKPQLEVTENTSEPASDCNQGKSAAVTVEKPSEKIIEKPPENTIETLSENTVEKPTEDVTEKPTEDITEKPAESAPGKIEVKNKSPEEEEVIEVEDTDDYLLYLEDILKKIHKKYYEDYDKQSDKSSPLPDLKIVIPEVKRQVLAGCHLVFSGLVMSHVPLQRSRAYAVAQSLGATVTAEVTPETTHLVAARAGTAKVNSSRRQKGVHIVTPLWLWQCAERWERLDERLYPLARGVVTNRHPPAHCGSPQHPAELERPVAGTRLRTDSGRFSDTINPLLTFSSEEMASMDQEVEDLCADDDDDSESEAEVAIRAPVLPIVEQDSSSSDSNADWIPKGWEEDEGKARKRKIDTTTCTESDLEEDSPSAKFRRGEPLPSDLDLGENSQDDTQDSQEDGDDSAWTLMGAVLEREFLSGD